MLTLTRAWLTRLNLNAGRVNGPGGGAGARQIGPTSNRNGVKSSSPRRNALPSNRAPVKFAGRQIALASNSQGVKSGSRQIGGASSRRNGRASSRGVGARERACAGAPSPQPGCEGSVEGSDRARPDAPLWPRRGRRARNIAVKARFRPLERPGAPRRRRRGSESRNSSTGRKSRPGGRSTVMIRANHDSDGFFGSHETRSTGSAAPRAAVSAIVSMWDGLRRDWGEIAFSTGVMKSDRAVPGLC